METATKRFASTLAQEVALLRSSVIGLIGKDSEGEYRPEFVADTLDTLDGATFIFSTPGDFLARIKNRKTKRRS